MFFLVSPNKRPLPGLLEVFPELKIHWPKWTKTRNGNRIDCRVDEDCLFPQTCCIHPILPGEKFCCTGFGKRRLIPAYQFSTVVSSNQKIENK